MEEKVQLGGLQLEQELKVWDEHFPCEYNLKFTSYHCELTVYLTLAPTHEISPTSIVPAEPLKELSPVEIVAHPISSQDLYKREELPQSEIPEFASNKYSMITCYHF